MKIMQVIGAKNSGGAELFCLRLIVALQKHCEVLPIVRERSWMSEELMELGIAHKTAPFGGIFDFKTKKILKKYIEDFKPDVVQGWMNRACKAFPKIEIPTVGRLGGYYDLKNYKNCDHLVGNTKDLKEYVIKQGWPKENSFYVPNFSPTPYPGFRENCETVRREYSLPLSSKVLFIAGRLHNVKGIDLAISALKQLDDNVYLLVAGSGAEETSLKELATKEGVADRVRFAGWVSRLSVVASAADIWLVPSRHEPLGNVVLDAWVHKIPVIAAEASGPKSLIEDGVSGLLTKINDIDTLAQAISKVLKDKQLREQLIIGGSNTLEKHFSEEVVVNKYLEFYRKISKKS